MGNIDDIDIYYNENKLYTFIYYIYIYNNSHSAFKVSLSNPASSSIIS
jgi:hypothetical protein